MKTKVSLSRLMSGSLMVAGTTIGAGMLGIPLVTGESGFMPACIITCAVWFFMLATGLLFLEVSLWMPNGSNVISMSKDLLGNKAKVISGTMFLFLYYCLLIAYIAAGTPLIIGSSSWIGYVGFATVIGLIVSLGAKWIDRTNIILTVAMVLAFVLLIGSGWNSVSLIRLQPHNFSVMVFAVPVLFSAFGYHNVIPSLTSYLNRDRKALQLSIVMGTLLALAVYLLWQYLIIGSVSPATIQEALAKGQTATYVLQDVTGNPTLFLLGRYFALFALLTSLLGVSFSMIDFLADGFSMIKMKPGRLLLSLLTFLPPVICTILSPDIFDRALGLAGGFGEAMLNGILPVALVFAGRYRKGILGEFKVPGGKPLLLFLFVVSCLVILLETYTLLITQ